MIPVNLHPSWLLHSLTSHLMLRHTFAFNQFRINMLITQLFLKWVMGVEGKSNDGSIIIYIMLLLSATNLSKTPSHHQVHPSNTTPYWLNKRLSKKKNIHNNTHFHTSIIMTGANKYLNNDYNSLHQTQVFRVTRIRRVLEDWSQTTPNVSASTGTRYAAGPGSTAVLQGSATGLMPKLQQWVPHSPLWGWNK